MGRTNVEIRNYLELDDEPYIPDAGCEVSPSCLNCPLSRCKHDDPKWYTAIRRFGPSLRLYAEMQRDHLSVSQRRRFVSGCTPGPLTRIKARVKDALGEDLDLTDQDLQILSALPPMHRPKGQVTIAPQSTSTRRRGCSMTTRTITHDRPKQTRSTSWPTTSSIWASPWN